MLQKIEQFSETVKRTYPRLMYFFVDILYVHFKKDVLKLGQDGRHIGKRSEFSEGCQNV